MNARLATPIESRNALEIAVSMANNRVRFVCVPVMDDEDYDRMNSLSMSRLDSLISRVEMELSQK